MEVEVTIRADGAELSAVVQTLSTLEGNADVDVTQEAVGGEDQDDQTDLDLSEEERYVLAALQESPGSALRVIHRVATDIGGSPFNDFDQDNGWNDERQAVRDHLWEMSGDGLTRNDGQLWYPTEDTPDDPL